MRCYLVNLPSALFYMLQDGGGQKRSLRQDQLSPLILAFCSSVHRYGPLHIYPCICSVAPCLRVLWMSTHGCLSPSFPFFYTGLSQPDAGVQELEIPRMILHGVRLLGVVRRSQAGGLAFSIVATFVLAFLRQTCLTYVCTQILLLPLTFVYSSLCIRALEALACNIKLVLF